METLSIETPTLFSAAVQRAATALRAGQLVVLPTETVYGLAANAFNAMAVQTIFQVKQRPSKNPIIVHVGSLPMAQQCVAEWPTLAQRLAEAFWPGPLTLVLRKSPRVPDNVTAGGRTVGIRWPSHAFIQAVIQECGFPLAAPSANLANYISPTMAEHVRGELEDQVALMVDGGPCRVGIESTVVDLSSGAPRILRPGMIHAEAIRAVAGEQAVQLDLPSESAVVPKELRSPGQLPKHYSPRAKLLLWRWRNEEELGAKLAELGVPLAEVFLLAHEIVPAVGGGLEHVSVLPHDAEAFARALYAELHRCDAEGAKLIVVEAVPESAEWGGIADRLARAAGSTTRGH